jgi:rhodanese-related sulfurtransferase
MRLLILVFGFLAFFSCKNDTSTPANNTEGQTSSATENTDVSVDKSKDKKPSVNLLEGEVPVSTSTDTVVHILTPYQFYKLTVDHPNWPIYDLRTKKEYEVGHVWRAISMDGSDPDFVSKMIKLGTETPIFIYCATGALSYNQAQHLRVYGHKKVYMIRDGLTNWSATGQAFQTK